MKKRIFTAAVMAALLAGMAVGCGSAKDIGRDAALETALNDAGVSESDTTRLRVSEDRDDGRKLYEIKFDVAEKEYEYEIQASDGAILSSEVDTNENYTADQENDSQNGSDSQSGEDQTDNAAQTDNTGQTDKKNQNSTDGTQTANTKVSREKAIQIVLERVPGATEQSVKIELERDDGRYKYEGEVYYNNVEYDFEIDANTGTILEWSEERD